MAFGTVHFYDSFYQYGPFHFHLPLDVYGSVNFYYFFDEDRHFDWYLYRPLHLYYFFNDALNEHRSIHLHYLFDLDYPLHLHDFLHFHFDFDGDLYSALYLNYYWDLFLHLHSLLNLDDPLHYPLYWYLHSALHHYLLLHEDGNFDLFHLLICLQQSSSAHLHFLHCFLHISFIQLSAIHLQHSGYLLKSIAIGCCFILHLLYGVGIEFVLLCEQFHQSPQSTVFIILSFEFGEVVYCLFALSTLFAHNSLINIQGSKYKSYFCWKGAIIHLWAGRMAVF